MLKKGQVTLFILLGIVIVAAIGLGIYFRNQIFLSRGIIAQEESVAVSQEAQQVKDFVKECMQEAASNALVKVASWGGKPIVGEETFTIGGSSTNYWYHNGEARIPELEEIEESLEVISSQSLEECTQKFKDFHTVNIQGKPQMAVKILNDEAQFYANWPLEVQLGATTEKLDHYNAAVETRFGLLYQFAKKTTEDKAAAKGELCLTCLVEMTRPEGVYPTVDVYDDNILITFIDSTTPINDQRLEYRFALQENLAA